MANDFIRFLEKGFIMANVKVTPKSVTMKVTVSSPNLSIRTSLTMQHVHASAHFARLSADLEKSYSGKVPQKQDTKHRAYVTGAIVSAAAFLEAVINEIYIDATERSQYLLKSLAPSEVEAIGAVWGDVEDKRISTLPKYQLALALAQKKKFEEGKSFYQDVASLIDLRNALVHYKPEWDTKQKMHKKIEDRLRGKFSLNPWSPKNAAFFPKKCLSYGCAEWAVSASIKFVNDFYSRLGVEKKVNIGSH